MNIKNCVKLAQFFCEIIIKNVKNIYHMFFFQKKCVSLQHILIIPVCYIDL